MSGHSHAKTVKRTKEANAKKRGQIFSKMARLISVAAKEAGPNPETNSKLRLAIEMAKNFNMPKENVERAIKKGSGELEEGENFEEVIFEAYGPGGIAIIIEGITDNKNRFLSEVKQTLSQHNGKLASEGSVKWMFERKGNINIEPNQQEQEIAKKENLEILAIEGEAEDIYWQKDDSLDIYTKAEELEKVKNFLEQRGVKINSVSLDWIAKEEIGVDEKTKQSCQKLFETLDENDAVQEIYSNIKLP